MIIEVWAGSDSNTRPSLCKSLTELV